MPDVERRAPRGMGILALLALLLAAVLPYLRVLDSPFVFDDVKLVRDNRFIRSGGEDTPGIIETFDILDRRWDDEELRPNYRPLRFLSYRLDYILSERLLNDFEPDQPPVFFFHLTNVLLHAANAILVFFLMRLLLGWLRRRLEDPHPEAEPSEGEPSRAEPRWVFLGALWAAVLFALHPLQTEAVTYISGRRDVLSTFFFLAALVLYLRTRPRDTPGPLTIILVPLFFAAGLLSKEMVITLPCVLLLVDLARRPRWSGERVAVHLLVWGVAAAFTAITLSNERLFQAAIGQEAEEMAGAPFEPTTFLTAARYVARYLRLAVLPYPQSVDYSFDAIPESTGLLEPWTTLPSLLLVGAIVVLGTLRVLRKRGRPWGLLTAVGLLWFTGTLVPVLQFVPIAERFAERFAYLPLTGGIIVFGVLIARLVRDERLLGHIVAGLLCMAALGLTLHRNGDWESPLTLWTSATEAQPRAARAHLGRANALKAAGPGFYREAIREYGRALEIFEEKPEVPLHHGFILQALTQRGSLLALLGARRPSLLPRAEADYRRVLASRDTDGVEIADSPRHTVLHFDLAGILMRQEKLREARGEYERVIGIGSPETLVGAAHYYLGKIALHEGDIKEALDRHRRAYESISPTDPVRYRVAAELADLLIDRKEYDEAWDLLEDALEDGASGRERLHLLYRQARILDRRGDLGGCVAKLEDILAVEPTYGPALLTLGGIRLARGEFDRAEAAYRTVPPTDPSYPEAQNALGNVQVRRKLAARRAEGPEPLSPEGLRVLQGIAEKGDGHVEREEWIAAREAFIQLLARARSAGRTGFELEALRELAAIEAKFSRYREAVTYLDAALEIEPADPDTLRRMGDLQLRHLQDRSAALRAYQRYLEVLPPGASADPMVHFNVAQLVSEYDPRRAIRHCLAARKGAPEVPLVNRTLGYLYAEVGEWGPSLDAFTSYLEATSGEESPERSAARRFVQETVLPEVMERP